MKRIRIIILLLAAVLLHFQTADAITVNGLNYHIDSSTKTAEVYSSNYINYTGDIVIPASITYQGQTYPVVAIGFAAFSETTVTSINLPNSITTIESNAFYNCKKLSKINFPNGLISIGNNAFDKCSITSISLPNSLTKIESMAFYQCPLTNLTLPNNLTKLGYGAFSGCKFTSIILPNSLTTIGEKPFSGLISAEIHCAKVVNQLFQGMTTLTTVVLGNEVTEIGNSAFSGCESLSSINLPQNLKIIGNSAFSGCTSLESITLPENIESLGENVFYQAGLKSAKIYCPIVSRECFYNNDFLEEVSFGNEVREIGLYSFDDCDALKSIVIPEGVTLIKSQAFYSCDAMETITLPKSLQTIESSAFSGLVKLLSITAHMRTPPVCGSNFGNRYKEATLYVPYGKVPVYKRTNNWKNFLNIVELPSEPGDVTGLTLNKQEATLMLGQSEQLIANIIPVDANDKSVTWTTSNKSIATVDADGTVTAIKPGTVNITCSSVDNESKTATCIVTVLPVPVTGIAISKSAISIVKGQTEKLEATITPDNATVKNVTWTSSNPDIAYVSSDGTVSARKVGTATITCTSNDNNDVKAVCTVTVTPVILTAIELEKTVATIDYHQTEVINYTLTPADADWNDVVWECSDSVIAEITSIKPDHIWVSGFNYGKVTVTARSVSNPEVKATCQVTVTPRSQTITKLTLNPSSVVIKESKTELIKLNISPTNVRDQRVRWEIADTSIVSQLGTWSEQAEVQSSIWGRKPGKTTLTCTSFSNPKATVVCEITVKPDDSMSFYIGNSVPENGKLQLSVSYFHNDRWGYGQTWKSADTSIATVDENGMLTGVKAGKTQITCTWNGDPSVSKTAEITVTAADLRIDKSVLIMNIGDNDTIHNTVFPEDRVIQTATWSSSSPSVATVDSAGVVRAVGAGTAVITCAWTWNLERKRQCVVYVRPSLIPAIVSTTVTGEYFFDSDPGYGLATPLITTDWGNRQYELTSNTLSTGAHILYIRCKDNLGRWSSTISRPLYVCYNIGIVAMEYFFDLDDPGEGNATKVAMTQEKTTELTFDVPINSLSLGQHYLNVRAKDSSGRWTAISTEPFTVVQDPTGIREAVIDFAFNIKAFNSRCLITPIADCHRNDCLVSLYDIAGQCVAKSIWKSVESQLSLPISIQPGFVLVVMIQDMKNGRRLARRLIVE